MVGSGKGAHTDYVRCGAVHPASNDTFVSGSYDHTVSSLGLSISIEGKLGVNYLGVRLGSSCITGLDTWKFRLGSIPTPRPCIELHVSVLKHGPIVLKPLLTPDECVCSCASGIRGTRAL
jgi:hypothetical protein